MPAVCRGGHDVPGLRDSVRNDQTGFLFSYNDERQLADGLTRLLTDAALRERMSRNALEWAHNFDWDIIAGKFWDVVERARAIQEVRDSIRCSAGRSGLLFALYGMTCSTWISAGTM